MLVLLVLAITGRLWLTTGLFTAASLGVAYANHEKLALRLEPVYPRDVVMLTEPGFLVDMMGAATAGLLVFFLLALVVGTVAIGRSMSKVFPPITRASFPKLHAGLLAVRGLAVLLAISGVAYLGQFNESDNKVRAVYESRGTHWRWWYQKLNYQTNGFVAGVLYNLDTPAMKKPLGYGPTAMRQIVERYTVEAATLNQSRASSLTDVNVVFVLSEAFTDPTRIRPLEFSEDPIPHTRALAKQTTSGPMLAQHYGGGTANMEFEALTGQSLALFEPQMNTPYQQLIPDSADYPSIVAYLKRQGHKAVAVHPYMTTMYQRDRVYPRLGFDKFVYDKTMQSAERLEDSEFISDRSAFGEVMSQLETEESPLLVNLVTMQNHYPMDSIYADPIKVSGTASARERERVGGYARGLEYTDAALRQFITELDEFDEPTVVVFYGDHQPAIYSEETQKENSDRALKETLFFLWSNYAEVDAARLPTTSPIYFMNHVFDVADAPLPPFYALLSQLEQEVPALEHGMMIGPDNSLIERTALSPRAQELLADYRLVQYDLSVGERFSERALFGLDGNTEDLRDQAD
jgi:hypothetical protein